MPSSTFENLNEQKKEHIKTALLAEFSKYTLAEAQVARIVKDAGIARGAFYKYFTDLTDAYEYLYRLAMQDIHRTIIRTDHLLTAEDYVKQTQDFVAGVNSSPYRDLVRLHFQTNEGLLHHQALAIKTHSAREWTVMVLSHETIKACLLNPQSEQEDIERLRAALQELLQ